MSLPEATPRELGDSSNEVVVIGDRIDLQAFIIRRVDIVFIVQQYLSWIAGETMDIITTEIRDLPYKIYPILLWWTPHYMQQSTGTFIHGHISSVSTDIHAVETLSNNTAYSWALITLWYICITLRFAAFVIFEKSVLTSNHFIYYQDYQLLIHILKFNTFKMDYYYFMHIVTIVLCCWRYAIEQQLMQICSQFVGLVCNKRLINYWFTFIWRHNKEIQWKNYPSWARQS